MPFDLDTLLGSDPSGLLTPQERGGVTGQSLMGMGAALLKAAAPSPYKHTTLSGLGEGVQGLLSSRQSATDELLKQHLVRAKTLEGALPLYKLMEDRAATGMPLPPWMQRLYQGIAPALGMPGGIGAGVPGAPGLPGTGAGVTPGAGVPGVSPPGASAAPATGGFKIPSDWRPPPQSPGALPPTDIRQYHADMNGFNRQALTPGAPGNAAFEKSFEEMHAGSPGFQLQKERDKVMEKEVEFYDKKYRGLDALGQIGAQLHETMQLGKALKESPGFFSGAGSDWVTSWRRLLVLAGRDPNTPLGSNANEIFKKVFSEALAKRVEDLGAAKESYGETGAARPLLAQLDILRNASPDTNMADPAIGTLMEQIDREALRGVKIADAAAEYASKHPAGRLDKAWDVKYRKMIAEDPTFSKEELRGIPRVQLPGNAPYPVEQGPLQPPGSPPPMAPQSAGAPGLQGMGGPPIPGRTGVIGPAPANVPSLGTIPLPGGSGGPSLAGALPLRGFSPPGTPLPGPGERMRWPGSPPIGTVHGEYKYIGGNHRDPKNWVRVREGVFPENP
jgi:hypothetical protein